MYSKRLFRPTLVAFLLIAFQGVTKAEQKQKYLPKEVTVFVTLKIKNDASQEHIKNFTEKYAAFVDQTEPDSLGWSYHQSGEKVILIERYKDEDANIVTAKNIAPNGIRYQLLKDQLEIFTVEKVSVFGAFTNKLIDFNAMTAKKLNFKFPFQYNPLISGYSKNAR